MSLKPLGRMLSGAVCILGVFQSALLPNPSINEAWWDPNTAASGGPVSLQLGNKPVIQWPVTGEGWCFGPGFRLSYLKNGETKQKSTVDLFWKNYQASSAFVQLSSLWIPADSFWQTLIIAGLIINHESGRDASLSERSFKSHCCSSFHGFCRPHLRTWLMWGVFVRPGSAVFHLPPRRPPPHPACSMFMDEVTGRDRQSQDSIDELWLINDVSRCTTCSYGKLCTLSGFFFPLTTSERIMSKIVLVCERAREPEREREF